MRVAFDTSPMQGRKTGIGVYTAQLLRALEQFAPHVSPILLDDGTTVAQRTDKRILREQFTLPRLANSKDVDLLHLTGFAAPLRSRVPVILTVMDLIGVLFSKNFPHASRFYWSRYLPFTLRAVPLLVTLSENTKRDVIRLAHIPSERITVIPPGVHTRFQPIADPSRLETVRAHLELPARFFLFVSTLEPRKGIDTLVNAYGTIAPEVREDLVIVGKRGWGYESVFDSVAQLGLQTRIHFLDYINDDDLPAVYNRATAFVFPSRYEGFGLTPLEAMACGAPVISSNASSLPEVIGDAGILLEPGNRDGFARAMYQVATQDDMRRELGARGIRRAKLFSWQRAAAETAACYARLLESPVSLP